MRLSFWESQSPLFLPHSRPDGFKATDTQNHDTRPTANNDGVYSGGVGGGTRLAGKDTVVVLCRIAAAVLGLVMKSFLEMIHASFTARTKHKKDCFRNRNKSNSRLAPAVLNIGLLLQMLSAMFVFQVWLTNRSALCKLNHKSFAMRHTYPQLRHRLEQVKYSSGKKELLLICSSGMSPLKLSLRALRKEGRKRHREPIKMVESLVFSTATGQDWGKKSKHAG